jgi:hypothetical protein
MASIARAAAITTTATLVALALSLALPAWAQEVESILNQKEWSVGGVGISDEYGTCAANDASHSDADIWLQVTETLSQNVINEVSVMHPGDPQATAAILQVGNNRFVLGLIEGERFSSAASDGGKSWRRCCGHPLYPAVRGCQRAETLQLRSRRVSGGLRGAGAALSRPRQSLRRFGA